jgi:D-alanyl-D-alanine carboxypeptidase
MTPDFRSPTRMRTRLTFLLLLFAVAAHADKVDDYIKSQMDRQHIPGLSLAVVKDGKLVKAKGYGLANVETNTPAAPETVYKIASVSKQFLATGIMLLQQDGKLSVDDRVSKYLDGTPDTWKDITIRHLLTHTSGIPRESPGFDPLKAQADADVVKTSYPLPLRFAPGEKWEYCNAGYFALGEIIRKVSGKDWDGFLAERVFTPIGMTATRATTMKDLVPNRAGGYSLKGTRLENAEIYLAVRPSGAFLSSALDLAKWDLALYSESPLTKTTRDQMWTPVALSGGKTHPYGFGWSLDSWQGHRQIHHGGSLAGFRSELARFPDDHLSVIVLTNLSSANPEIIARGVAGLFLPAASTVARRH